MKTLLACLVSTVSLGAFGCGGSSVDIETTPLAGTVFGAAWTFQAGHTSAFLSDDMELFSSLYPETFTACGFSEPDGPHLLMGIPTAAGEYELGFGAGLTVTFAQNADNKIATEGLIVVDEVTATRVTGGLYATFDGDNEVNGRFDVTICPPDAAVGEP